MQSPFPTLLSLAALWRTGKEGGTMAQWHKAGGTTSYSLLDMRAFTGTKSKVLAQILCSHCLSIPIFSGPCWVLWVPTLTPSLEGHCCFPWLGEESPTGHFHTSSTLSKQQTLPRFSRGLRENCLQVTPSDTYSTFLSFSEPESQTLRKVWWQKQVSNGVCGWCLRSLLPASLGPLL